MNAIECRAFKCAYNVKGCCTCSNVKISALESGAKCNSYRELPHYCIVLKDDVEIAADFDTTVCCSAENCVFNIHYACKAREVKIDEKTKACRSFYGM